MEWYEEVDFDENPFNVETKFVGQDDILEEMFYSVLAGNMLFIEGETGTGKTRLLKEAIKKFGGHGKVIYMNCKNLNKELNVERLLKDKYGWFTTKVLNKKPKNMILLLDDVEHLSSKNAERIKYYFDQNYLRSVIFVSSDLDLSEINDSIRQRMYKKLKLKNLSDYEAVQMVKAKLGPELLNDRLIKHAYKISNKNNKQFLKNCEKICKVAVNKKNLNEKEIQDIINNENDMAVAK
ncbi:MAG: ATP-binding protein [Nanoarchaeota archaeon]|nr:ATP-binding protein [Nanoarchaeota archaeon]